MNAEGRVHHRTPLTCFPNCYIAPAHVGRSDRKPAGYLLAALMVYEPDLIAIRQDIHRNPAVTTATPPCCWARRAIWPNHSDDFGGTVRSSSSRPRKVSVSGAGWVNEGLFDRFPVDAGLRHAQHARHPRRRVPHPHRPFPRRQRHLLGAPAAELIVGGWILAIRTVVFHGTGGRDDRIGGSASWPLALPQSCQPFHVMSDGCDRSKGG
jgi:hypothetical protein